MDLKSVADRIADNVGTEFAKKIEDGEPAKAVISAAVKEAIYRYESAQTRDWAINGRW